MPIDEGEQKEYSKYELIKLVLNKDEVDNSSSKEFSLSHCPPPQLPPRPHVDKIQEQ